MVESRKEIRQRELRERGAQLAVFGLMDSDRGDGSARHAISILFPATSDFLSVTVNLTNFTYPFSTQFTFFNEGYFSAHEVRGACELNSVLSASKTVKHVLSPISMKPFAKIRPKGRLTIPCVLPIRIGPIKYPSNVCLPAKQIGFGNRLTKIETL